jgi:hypothetical protein
MAEAILPINGRSMAVDKGTDSDKFTTTTLNDGDVVTVILTSDLACASTPTATSNPITITSTSVDPAVSIVARVLRAYVMGTR